MESSLGFVSDIALKATLLLTIAALVTAIMHRRSAAVRHMVWAFALTSALVLPVVSVSIPAWSISVPYALVPTLTPTITVSAGVTDLTKARNVSLSGTAAEPSQRSLAPNSSHTGHMHNASVPQPGATAPQPMQSLAAVTSPRPAPRSASPSIPLSVSSSVSWPAVAFFIWLTGMLLVVAHLVLGAIVAHRVLRRAVIVIDERWNNLFSRTKAQLWLRRRVVLLQSERVTTPAAWGIFHPVVVVPVAADGWSNAQRHAVLLHELAHVERWDCLTHVLAQLACAVYWFNPLAWWANHQLNTERERACDDRALGQGARPSSYAEQLMTIAYSYQGWHRQPIGALPMAKPSQLEDRVRRILDRAPRRGANKRSTTVRFGAVAACLVVSIAAIRPHVAPQLDALHHAAPLTTFDPRASTVQSGAKAMPQRIGSNQPQLDTLTSGTNDVHWSGTLVPGDTIAIRNLVGEIRAEPAQGNRVEIVAQRHAQRDDPRTVQIQIERRDHEMVLCSVYPEQLSKNCDSYDFDNHGGHYRDCSEGRDHCGSDVKVDWVVRVPANVRLSASTVAGDITATGLQNDVAATSVGGHIDVSTAGHARASSMSAVNVSMGKTDWSGDLKLYSGSGLTVTLPATANTELEAASTFGSVQSDFPLQQSDHNGFGTKASGIVGTGGRTLRLQSLGGRIAIRNAAVPATGVAAGGESSVAQRFYYRGRRNFVHVNVDSIMRTSRRYAEIDRARIQADVGDAMDGVDIAGTVSEALRAADIPGTVERAMKAANVERTIDSAMRAARIPETVDSAVRAAHIGATVRDAMRAAFGDSTVIRPRPRDK